MIRRHWLTACVLVAACSDPDAPSVSPALGRVQQQLGGLPIYHHEIRTLRWSDGSVAYQTGRDFSRRKMRSVPPFVDDSAGALRKAGAFGGGRARPFWYPLGDQLVAAWVVEHYTAHDLIRTVIAADGHVIARDNLVADAAFTYTVWADPTGEKHPYDGPQQDATPHPTGSPDASYPAYVPPNQVTVDSLNGPGDPWLPDGATETVGNNVDAYIDVNAPNGLTDGDFRASATGSAFAHTYNTSLGPLANTEQQMAGVTSLFYIINWLHDFWYDAGFTEAAGNAQANNYGRGGIDGDVLVAEAQDNAAGGSRNNANMSTPDDGMSPRMQVYLWSGRDTKSIVLQPSGRAPLMGAASYGPRDFTFTAAIVLGQDGMGANPTDGCTPFTNSVSGKLVLVDRGNCTFKTKTVNAQNAGAVAVLIANNVSGSSPPALGDDANLTNTITIPSISVTQDEGAAIKTELGSTTVTATASRQVAPELDGSLDSTLVAHEFGHYLHHRLSLCGNAICRAMSEGWGDFTALMLLARPGDDLHGAFPFSVYVTQGFTNDPGYYGIRRAPYSVDPTINSLSFRHMADGEPLPTTHPFLPTNNNAEIHNAGEIWAEALWEVYIALQDAGAEQGLSFTDVRGKMARYVVTGLALTPTEASPIEVRDSLLAAALAVSPADYAVMAAAFARRGFGSCAVPPPEDSVDFVGIVESTAIAGNAKLQTLAIEDSCDGDGVLDAGETAHVKMRVINQGHAPLTNVHFQVTSQQAGLHILSPATQLAQLDTFATADLEVEVALDADMPDALAADLALQVTADDACEQTVAIPLATRLNIDDLLQASTTDTFDAQESNWEPWAAAWHHLRETPLDGIWHGDNLPTDSDTRLTSPPLVASTSTPVTMTFSHRFAFEFGNGTAWDGGVIEYSIDNGVSWDDVSTIATVPYVAPVGNDSGNPLADRNAFVGQNATYPEYETVSLDFGDALSGQTFRIRFRIGTDAGTGAAGWDIDDVAFTGILGKPFPTQVPDDGVCGPPGNTNDPIIAGGGGCQTGGGMPGWLVACGLALRVRRRRRGRASSARGA